MAVRASDEDRVDWSGVMHAPAPRSPRIASLVPSLTETLFALDLGNVVVARTGFCIHPRGEVKRVPKVGGTKTPDLDRLRALAPTHLLVNVDENKLEHVEAARAFVPNIVVTDPRDPLDNRRLLRLIGALFDRTAQAQAAVAAFDASLAVLDEVANELPRERVLYLIWRDPWMTVARDTYIAATLARAGFDTLPESAVQRYPALQDDDPAWREADRLLLSSEPYAFRERDVQAVARARGKPATRIDGEWTSWYGSRAAIGLSALAAWRRRLS